MAKKGFRKPKLKEAAKQVAAAGRNGDTEIVHVNKNEMPIVDRVLKRYGGKGSTNPKTGKKEYFAGGATDAGNNAARDAADRMGGGSGKSSGSSGGNSSTTDRTVPTASKAPVGKQPLGPGGSLAAAAANQNLGDQGDSAAATSMGARPMNDYKPGDVPAVKGADAVGIGARVFGGITGAVGSALSQGLTGEDKTQSLLGGEHFGKQVGWSSGGDETGARPGKTDQPNTTPTVKAPAAAATSTSTSSSTSAGTSGSSFIGGQTITVNPDGTVRTQDTSVAGLRAKRRYGAKTAAG